MQLRPYQLALINDIKVSLKQGHKSPVAVLGCGGGKSVIISSIAKSTTAKNNRVLFLVHRKELVNQIKQTFKSCGVDMTLCDVMMIQTARRKVKFLPDYKVIIIDECHTNLKAYKGIRDNYPNAVIIGFTATPVRLNEGGLGELFDDIVTSVSTKWLIENKYLSPYQYFSIPLVNTDELHIQGGEYKQDEINALMENNFIYKGAVEQYKKLANGRKTMVYCSSVKSSKETAEEFRNAGISAEHIDGTTPQKQRDEIIDKFRKGEIKVLCNVMLLNEGFDDRNIECVIMLRPTLSLALYIQMSMRGMRYKEGKICIILDCVNCVSKHGLPDDDRKWSLESKKKQATMVKIRECPNCYGVYPPTMNKCPYCQAELTHEVRTVNRKTVDVDLVEIKRQEEIKNTKLADAELKSWEQVQEFQKLHGYKFQWCFHYCKKNNIKIPPKYRKMYYRIMGGK